MIFLKNYYANTTKDVDILLISHDIRYAIRDSKISNGLVTVSIPTSGAHLLVSEKSKEALLEIKEKWEDPGFTQTISLSLPLQNKELTLDPKQMIYLIDYTQTGKRREFHIQVMGEDPSQQKPQGQGERRNG